MYILGINAYHGGASACLIRDGLLIAAVEEERFRRIKYWAGFPTLAIQYCLASGGITPADLDHIGISRDPAAHLHRKALYALRRRPNFDFIRSRLSNMAKVRDLKTTFLDAFNVSRANVSPRPVSPTGHTQFHNVEHHHAHMASAFFVAPFAEAAVLSVDGMGDFVSTMWGSGKDTDLRVDGAIHFPHSLGYLYTLVSQWLGFPKYGDEGKVMGLAPYGEPVYLDRLRKIARLQRDGTFELDTDYLALDGDGLTMSWDNGEPVIGTMFSQKFVDAFGPPRVPRSALNHEHENMAASLQVMLEEAEFGLVRLLERSGHKALCMAGGVALNSAFNGKVLPNTTFTDIFIQPAAGDAGTALGVCYYIYHQLLHQPRRTVMYDAYTDPAYDDDCIAAALESAGFTAQRLDAVELCGQAAELVAAGNVVGWFQGRMEWGPRALGNRSILADPRRADMKDILNARIKHREPFRPFAPSVLLEETGAWFDQTYPDPFMHKVYGVHPEQRARVPAITHVDGTGRLQTVDRAHAPLYWQVIDAFRRQTGVPMLLNTSFNENEPICCKPEEAIDCFARTKMDALAFGSYLVRK